MSSLLQELQIIAGQQQHSQQPTDLAIGTVTAVDPLEITKDVHQQALRQEVLYLTESVVEKKIPVLEHNHYAVNLGHTHTCPDGTTSEALTGRYLPNIPRLSSTIPFTLFLLSALKKIASCPSISCQPPTWIGVPSGTPFVSRLSDGRDT